MWVKYYEPSAAATAVLDSATEKTANMASATATNVSVTALANAHIYLCLDTSLLGGREREK